MCAADRRRPCGRLHSIEIFDMLDVAVEATHEDVVAQPLAPASQHQRVEDARVLLQHDQIATRTLRVVAPLVPLSRVELPISRLNPVFDIEGLKLVLSTLEIAGISSSFLGGDIVMSLASRRDDIIAAVDFLVTGI